MPLEADAHEWNNTCQEYVREGEKSFLLFPWREQLRSLELKASLPNSAFSEVSGLKSVMVGVLTPQTLANATNEGFSFMESWFTSTPLFTLNCVPSASYGAWNIDNYL